MLHYYLLDIETTGFMEKVHDITEISAIKYDNTAEKNVQFTKIIRALNPENANLKALEVTHKTMADLYCGEELEDSLRAFCRYVEEDGAKPNARVIVGYGIDFDLRFLHYACGRYGIKFPADMYFDLYRYMQKHAKAKYGKVRGIPLKLGNALDEFEIKKYGAADNQHTAKIDTRNTYALFHHVKEEKKADIISFIKTKPHRLGNEEEVIEEEETED